MVQFAALRPKAYCCLIDDSDENKKAKGTKKCVTKRNIKFKDYKNCLEENQLKNETMSLISVPTGCVKKLVKDAYIHPHMLLMAARSNKCLKKLF